MAATSPGGKKKEKKAGTGKPSAAKTRPVAPGSGSKRTRPTPSEIF